MNRVKHLYTDVYYAIEEMLDEVSKQFSTSDSDIQKARIDGCIDGLQKAQYILTAKYILLDEE